MIRLLLKIATSPLRLFRWNYVAPRLLLLFVLLCVSEVGVGWLTEWSLESYGSEAVGARVEINGSKASLLKTRVALTGIQVADPDDPMTNLLEADLLDLDFDTASALRRQVVVEHGTLHGLRLGGERATSGALESTEQPAAGSTSNAAASAAEWAGSAAADRAQQWLTELESRLSADAVEGLRSPALVERLQAVWPERAERLCRDAAEFQQRIERLGAAIDHARQNPLRGIEALRTAPGEVAKLSREAARLREEIGRLPGRAADDRRQIAEARRHDEQLIRRRLSVDDLDPEMVSAYLLGDPIGGQVGRLIEMLRWARGVMPAGQEAAPLTPSRGVEVRFDSRRRPDLLVKRIDIRGSARVADRPLELAGLLTNFTTQPTLHDRPTELRLAATGGLPFEVLATFDRSGPQPRDVIVANCQALPIPPLRLGGAKWLNLESRPSTATMAINLELAGDALRGELRLVQEGFAVRPAADLQNASPSDWLIADSLANNLSRDSRVETTVRLSGDLNRPSYRFESTLGATVAGVVRDTIRQVAQSRAESLLAESSRGVDDQLAELEETIASVTADLGDRVRGQTEILERFADLGVPGPFGRGGVFNLGARPAGQPR